MRIGTPRITSEAGHTRWSVAVEGLIAAPDTLWYEVPDEYAGLLTELADPAVIGLLVPAMHLGATMVVDGPVTDELAHNVRHAYQHILRAVIDGLDEVALEARQCVRAGQARSGVGTGFSAGIDSFSVLVDHHLAAVPPDLRLTHLTYFNVGSHGRGDEGSEVFKARHARLQPTADEVGLPLVRVDSNLDDFYNFSDFQHTNGPRNISAASLLQGGIGRYYFAGSFSYKHVGVRRSHDTAFSDPISLPLLTTNAFRPIPHGEQYTRVQKTILIVTSAPSSLGSLDVCVRPPADGRNCSRCFKCMRTQLTLEIAGRLDDSRSAFDLDLYRDGRSAHLDEVAVSGDEFAAEIRDFARESGFRLPKPVGVRVRRVQARTGTRARRAAVETLAATGSLNAVRSARAALQRSRYEE